MTQRPTEYRREDYVTPRQRRQDGTDWQPTQPPLQSWASHAAPTMAVLTGIGLMLFGADLMQSGQTGLITLTGLLVAWAGLSLIAITVWAVIRRHT